MPSTLVTRTSLLFAVTIAASLAKANLVQNGSFEQGEIPSPGTVISISPGSSRIAGWTISTQELAWWNGDGYGVGPADGQCHLDLFGFHDHFPSAVISQYIATAPGTIYRVSFKVGRYNANSQVRLRAGSEFADFASDGLGISWKTANWEFTATSNSTLLSFEAGPLSSTIHAGLDDVVVTPEAERVAGVAILEGYSASPVGDSLAVEVWQGGSLVGSLAPTLGADGSYGVSPMVSGSATLRFRYRTGLWKAVAVNLGSTPIENVDVTMSNGDCDGDNEVGIGDYSVLSAAYGSSVGDGNWAENADLNGDETVDIADYAILSANYGEVGD